MEQLSKTSFLIGHPILSRIQIIEPMWIMVSHFKNRHYIAL